MAVQRARLEFDLSGIEEIKSLAKRRAITLKAVKAGAKPVAAAVKARAPRRKGSGALKQSIGIKAKGGKKNRTKTAAYAVIGPRRKVVKFVKNKGRKSTIKAVPANYAHVVEKGTRPHSIKKGTGFRKVGKHAAPGSPGIHPGAKAKPFLAPAWRSTKSQALEAARQVFATELKAAIAKQAAKFGKRKAR